MDPDKRERLEAVGWRFGDAGDFLELTDVERRIIEVRWGLAKAVRAGREGRGMTRKDLATAIGSSQSWVAKIEAAAPDVTVGLMLRALFTAGGRLPESLATANLPAKRKAKASSS